jgi:NADPH:quinone reductase-like Zn-dependent oxidoreductase
VQLAHAAGAQTVTTGRGSQPELLAELGADEVIEVERQPFEEVAGAVGRPRPDARWVFFVVEADRAELAELGRRIDAGQLRPIVGGVWPLAEGRQAFQAKRHGGLPGKAVLRVAEEPLSRRRAGGPRP